ncbi:unnamed protein product [Rhizophagus irregularis]|nr:unnamed protein product [Rhizophagus irregularis]
MHIFPLVNYYRYTPPLFIVFFGDNTHQMKIPDPYSVPPLTLPFLRKVRCTLVRIPVSIFERSANICTRTCTFLIYFLIAFQNQS